MKFKRFITMLLTTAFVAGIVPMNAMALDSAISVTVGKGDGYDYHNIQDAVNSITETPSEKYPATIKIAPGIYEEEVVVDKPYIKLVNNQKDKDVVITYDKANGHSDSNKNFGTDKTATFTVDENGVGFSATNITFKNSYNIGTDNKQTQAVAFESMADKVVLDSCKFIGRQDTLYLKGASKGQNEYGSSNNARVYIKDSYIEGTVDYIFGDATAYFDNCDLYMVEYENGGHFTAPNTTLFNIGYVFNSCRLNVSDKFSDEAVAKIDLGRPWQSDSAYPYIGSNSVYINCTMPQKYNNAGFSTWDSNTITNKVRFMEYGSIGYKNTNVDTTNRASFVKELNEEQAKYFNAYNVLKGNDNWNPTKKIGEVGSCDITLDNYTISIPQGETYKLKAIALPMENKSEFTYLSNDENIATIANDGTIKANNVGKTSVVVSLPTGLQAVADVEVTAPRTNIPTIDEIKIESNNHIMVGNLLKAKYTYELASDNNIDSAIIRWYAVKGSDEYLIKEGIGDYYKSYTPQTRDIGYQIKMEVLPATKTTYGAYGEAKSYTTEQVVETNVSAPEQLLRENFSNGLEKFATTGKWNILSNDHNSFASADTAEQGDATMFYKDGSQWNDINFSGRFRFNPSEKGLASDGEFNIYFDHSDNSYYRLKLGRGSNTKSLKLYLYKKSADLEETLLASDETSLKNNIYQNAGEDNPYFNIDITKNNGKISVVFRLEQDNKKLATLTATDSENNLTGSIGFGVKGGTNVVLIDNISVEGYDNTNNESKIRLFLLGDSTAKNYGDDNTIGGWGEYLVNYFDSNVEIINKAEGGRSARSYLNQGRLKEVTDQLTPDDYVFVQFGTNDQRTDDNAFMEHSVALGTPDEYGNYPTNPAYKTKTPDWIYNFYKDTEYPYGETFYPYESGTFKWYMKQHIDAIKKTGATPVLLTPMCRMFFDSDGKITSHFGDDDGYIVAIRQLAKEENIMCLDMYDITKSLYESYGVLTTQGLHNIKSDGTIDLTHYNKFGANLIASKMAEDIKSNTNMPLYKHIINSSVTVEKTTDLKTANLYVVGGTYAQNDKSVDYAINGAGFGDYLQNYLNSKITVTNLGVANSTAKSYINTEQYKNLMNNVKEGDYVILSFGNDDCKTITDSYAQGSANDKNSFAYNLYNYYIKPLQDKNVVIIALTPFANRVFTDGVFSADKYAQTDAITKLVVDKGLFFVNTYEETSTFYNNMGEEGSKVLNAYDRKTGIMPNVLSEFGANLVAKKILSNLTASSVSLKDYVLTDKIALNPKMTKADYVDMVMNVINQKGSADNNFDDVTMGKYYYNSIALAKKFELINGDSDNKFYPETSLTGDLVESLSTNVFRFLSINGKMEDVYTLAQGEISPEIGIWAVDRLYEELNK